MSFKTSVLIWFSRSRGTASPQPNGVGLLCETEEHGFRQQRDIFLNDISSGDIVTKEHMTMLLTSCSFVTMSFKAATMSSSGNKLFK